MSLKKSLFWSYFTRYSEIIIQFGSSIFVARLLTPEEIGTFSVVLSLIGFALLLREFGIGDYIIQEKDLNTNKVRSAYTLGLIFSWILAVLVFLSADFIAEFYQKQNLLFIVQIISINFVLIPFNSIICALFKRNMQFHLLTIIEVSSALIYGIVAVFLAFNGFGTLSLVWASISSTIVITLLCWLLRPPNFSYIPTLKKISAPLNYGGYSSAGQIIRHAGSSAPNIIIGKILDLSAVGFFKKGFDLFTMTQKVLLGGLKPILMPYFSQIHRENKSPIKVYFVILNITLAIIWPALAFLIFQAPILIELFYGPQWQVSIPILQTISLGAMFGMIAIFTDVLFKATGHIKKFFVIETIMTPLRISAVVIGAQFGLLTIVKILAILPLIRVCITYILINRYFQIDFRNFFKILIRNMTLLIFCIAPLFITQFHTFIDNIYLKLLLDIFLIAIIWILGMYLLNKEIVSKVISRLNSKQNLV